MTGAEPVRTLKDLRIKIFYDGSDKEGMVAAAARDYIHGFTTNPTLMREAGVEEYEAFAREMATQVEGKAISFEVFADDFSEMGAQARKIHQWGENVYVKIPISNASGVSSADLIRELSGEGIKLNITAVFSVEQVAQILPALSAEVPSIVSVFAGRIGETGRDPIPVIRESARLMKEYPSVELLWAATREVYDVFEAEDAGADIITVSPKLIQKFDTIGLSLEEMSLRAVQTFYKDGAEAGYSL